MTYIYDDTNIFAKILRGDIPNKTVLDTPYTLAFHDINPLAPMHVLVIPKGAYVSYDHFCAKAQDAEIIDFNRSVAQICTKFHLHVANGGFRAITNAGPDGGQEVPHFHLHLLGGRPLGPMLARQG